MNKKEKIFKEIKFVDNNRLTSSEFYTRLNNAIKSNNTQSIWELSKIISRQLLKKI